MAKKSTFTCKICGQEHAGLLCTKYTGARIVPTPPRKQVVAGLLAAPKPPAPKAKLAKKPKKKKRTKKRTAKPRSKAQPIAPPAENGLAGVDTSEDKS